MVISPQFLSVKNITEVLEAHPVVINRKMLDHCVFAIDMIYMEEARSSRDNASKKDQDQEN